MIGNWRYALALGLMSVVSCAGLHRQRSVAPVAVGYMGRPVTFAVVPAKDLSGTGTLDALALTDTLASELAQVPGISVVPVSQTVAVMLGQGWRSLESPSQACLLARMLHADGVVVLAATEYDPYQPPRLGLIGEVYLVAPRSPSTWPAEDGDRLAATQPSPAQALPDRQTQRVFDGRQEAEQKAIRRFARRDPRASRDWQDYLRNQRLFLRYCSWQTVMDLVGGIHPPADDEVD